MKYASVMLGLNSFVASQQASAAPLHYGITDIGTLPNGPYSIAWGPNNKGQVTGGAGTPVPTCSQIISGPAHAFLYSDNKIVDLGLLPGYSESVGRAINDWGQVVGNCYFSLTKNHVFLYDHAKMMDLGTVGGSISDVRSINNKGQITGTAGDSGHAFLYENGRTQDLGTLCGSNDSYRSEGNAINNQGQVTGGSVAHDFYWHAFIYSNGKMTDLGLLPGFDTSVGNAINDRSQITGKLETSGDAQRPTRAFFYSHGRMKVLGTLGGNSSEGLAINNQAEIVGTSDILFPKPRIFTSFDPGRRAFQYRDGKMYNLNDLIDAHSGWLLESATGINEKGQIVGYGKHDGKPRAFLLTPKQPRQASL